MYITAGRYFIGDPCYAVKDELWGQFCENLWEAEKLSDFEGAVDINGVTIFASSTLYGDGCYQDKYGNEYPVDAGLIGAVPLDAGITQPEYNFGDLGLVVEFEEDTRCVYLDDEGYIRIGNYTIATGDDEDEDEDEYS